LKGSSPKKEQRDMMMKMKMKDSFTWDEEPPVSPTGQYLRSSVLSVNNIVVMESEIPIDDSPTMETLESQFLPVNPRFSSIMVFSFLILYVIKVCYKITLYNVSLFFPMKLLTYFRYSNKSENIICCDFLYYNVMPNYA
jgi:hypothetical protein